MRKRWPDDFIRTHTSMRTRIPARKTRLMHIRATLETTFDRHLHMSYKINFNESIPDMIVRLEKEHRYFRAELDRSANLLENNQNDAIGILSNLSQKIIQHAVEEEARLVRIIMEKAKAESEQSIHVMQEHNYVVDFIKHNLPELHKLQITDARNEVTKFVKALKEHFVEEEEIVFPLASRLAA